MAKGFNLTAQINLQGPNNLKVIIADIKRQLGTVGADVKIKLGPEAAKSINSVTSRLKSMNDMLVTAKNNTDSLSVSLSSLSSSLSGIGNAGSKTTTAITKTASSAKTAAQNIKQATTEMEAFGKQSALAIRRFAAFSVVSGAIYKLVNAINSGFSAFVSFDKQLIKLQQVTGKGAMGLKALENQITSLATSLGVSSESLIEVASTLAQAGLSAEETRIALAALAKTELAPSFDSLTETTEGAIAALRQFELSAGDLEAALGSINAVAAAFAVESSDIITAIQRTGGVFAAASKGVSQGKDALNEFIAVFTSVRATTRESAETIATGLRTIFTRIQRGKTIEQLKDFGIILTDLEGKFVGPFEAIKRLSEGLRTLDPRDLRFSQIVEELGGFRQIGKVIPLIQQFAEAQKALKVAQAGQSSLTDAQLTAQKSLANQIAKVREQFLALIRDIGKTNTFKAITSIVLNLASSFISLASAFKPILPFLAILGTIKGIKAIGEFGTGFFGGLKSSSGGSTAKNIGSNIGSTISGSKEQERAATTKLATDAIQSNTSALKSLTTAVSALENTIKSRGSATLSSGGKVLGFNTGGIVPGSGKGDKVPALLEPGEVVINNKAANKYGRGNLVKMNRYALGGKAAYVADPNEKSFQSSHFGADIPFSREQFIAYSSIYQNATFQQSLKEAKAKLGPKATIDQIMQELGIKVKNSIKLSLPKSFNQALKTGDPGLVDKNDLISAVNSGENIFKNFTKNTRLNDDTLLRNNITKTIKNINAKKAKNYNTKYDLQKLTQQDLNRLVFDEDNELNSIKYAIINSVSAEEGRRLLDNIDILFKSPEKELKYRQQSRVTAKQSNLFGSGGKIQKFMAGSPGGINVPSGKGRGVKRTKGARNKFKHLNPKELADLSTEEALAYARDEAYALMTTGGSGMKVGEEFIEVPQSRIIPELEGDLVVGPNGKMGFWREKISPFGAAQIGKTSKSTTQKRRERFFDRSRELLTAAAQGIMAPGSALSKEKKAEYAPELEQVIGDYGLSLSATPRIKAESPSVSSTLLDTLKAPLSSFRQSGGQTSLAGVIPLSAAAKIKAAIPSYIESLKKEGENQKVGKAQTALQYFDDFVSGKTASKPGHATAFTETINQILKSGLVTDFAKGGLIQGFEGGSTGTQGVQPLESAILARVPKGQSLTGSQILSGPFPNTKTGKEGLSRWVDTVRKIASEILGGAFIGDKVRFGEGDNIRSYALDKAISLQQLNAASFKGKIGEDNVSKLVKLREKLLDAYAEAKKIADEQNDMIVTDEDIANARKIAVVGFKSDRKNIDPYYRKRNGIPLNVYPGIAQEKDYADIERLWQGYYDLQMEAASSMAARRGQQATPVSPEERKKLGIANAQGYDVEFILQALGTFNGKKSGQDAVDFINGLSPLAADVFGVPPGIPTQAKLTLNSGSILDGIDGLISTFAFGGKADGPGFEEVKKQIIDKYPEIDFRISKRKRGFGYMIQGGLSPAQKSQVDFASNLSDLSKVSDQMAQDILYNYGPKIDPSLLKKLQKKKFASGGFVKSALAQSQKTIKWGKGPNAPTTTSVDPRASALFSKKSTVDTIEQELSKLGISALKFIGSGKDSLVYDAGNDVVKFSPGGIKQYSTNIPEQLKPSFSKLIEGYGVEVMPKVDTNVTDDDLKKLQEILRNKGYMWGDAALDNMGKIGNRLVVIDGDIEPLKALSEKFTGGFISKLSSGGTVPAMVSAGEAFVPPQLAKKIGYSRLNKMNQADRNGMRGFAGGGGISVFKGPGSGTSDSIGPIGLPEGSFIIREKATKALGLNKGGYVGLAAGGFPELTPEMAAMVQGIQKSTTQKYSKQYKAAPSITLAGSNDLNKEQIKLVAQAEYETAAMKAIVESIKLTKDQRDNINKLQQEITAKYQDEYKSATDTADKAAIKAKAQIEFTTQAREQVFGSAKPTVTKPETLPKINPKMAEEQKKYLEMRAEKAGMSVGGYKYSMAQKVGQNKFNVEREMTLARDETKSMAVGRSRELKGVNISEALQEGNTSQEAQRVQSVIADFTAKLQEADPSLGTAKAREAAIALATGLSEGTQSVEEIIAANKTLNDSLNGSIDANKVLEEAFRRTSVEMGESVANLKANVSSKQIEQQAFIQSKEGQRFGKLAEFAPGLTQKISKTGVGKALGGAADFISGKGGKFSKGFAALGGFQGIGSGLAVGSEALKNSGLISKQTLKDPNVAGAFGAVQGAGVMGATGAELGSQLGGPIGALIGGIGGAIIGGIKGFFDAKNAQVLQNALDKLTKSSEAVDVAFKELAKNDTDKNFKNVQKAFGQQIESAKELEAIAFGDGGEGPTVAGVGGAALAGAGAGALVGSFIAGPIGTAIGGAIGGLVAGGTALMYANQSKANKEEAIKGRIGVAGAMNEGAARMAERQMGRMTTEQLTQIGGGGTNIIADQYKQSAIAAAEAADSEKKLTSQQKEKIGQNAIDSAYLDAYMKQRKEAGATDQQITDDILKDRKTALLAGKQALDSQQEAAKKQQQLARATKEVALATENLLDVYRRVGANVQRFSDEIDDMLGNTKATTSSLRGNAALRDVDRSGSERVLGNMAAYSTEEVRAATQEMVGKLGGGEQAQALGKQTEAAKFLQDKLPGMLRNENADPQQIMSDIRNEMDKMGIGGGAVDKMLSEIEKQISTQREGGMGTLAEEISTGGIDKLSMTAAEAAKTLQNLSKTYNDALQKSIDLQNAYNESVMQSNSFLRKAGTIRLNAELDLSRALGNSPTLAQLNEPFDFEIRDLTKGLVPGGTTDPAQIAAGIVAKTEENKKLEEAKKAIGNEGMQGVSAADQGAELLAKNQELGSAIGSNVVAINEGRQALEKLANDGSKAANALAKIEEQQRQIEGLGNRFEKIFTASPEELFKMNKQSAALSAAQQGGSELFKSRAFRQDAFAGLEQDKEFLTPEEFRKQRGMLMRKSFEAQGYTGESMVQKGGIQMTLDELIKRIEGGMPSEEDPNVKAYREAVSTQIAANKELAKLEEIASLGIQESMLDLQDFLAKEFPKILTDAVTASKTDAETKPETGASKPEKSEKQKQAELDIGIAEENIKSSRNVIDGLDRRIKGTKDPKELKRLRAERDKEQSSMYNQLGNIITARGVISQEQSKAKAKEEETKAAQVAAEQKTKEEKVSSSMQTANTALAQGQQPPQPGSREARRKALEARKAGVMAQPAVQPTTAATPAEAAKTAQQTQPTAQVKPTSAEPPKRDFKAERAAEYKRLKELGSKVGRRYTQSTELDKIREEEQAAKTAEKTQKREDYLLKQNPRARQRLMTKAEKEAGLGEKLAQREAEMAAKTEQTTSPVPIPAPTPPGAAAPSPQDKAKTEKATQEVMTTGSLPTVQATTPQDKLSLSMDTLTQSIDRLAAIYSQQAGVPQTPTVTTNGPIPITKPLTPETTTPLTPTGSTAAPTGETTGTMITIDPASLEGLASFNKTFGEYVNQLVSFSFPPIEGKVDINHKLEINMTGAASIASLDKHLKDLAVNMITPKLQELESEIKKSIPGFRTSDTRGSKQNT